MQPAIFIPVAEVLIPLPHTSRPDGRSGCWGFCFSGARHHDHDRPHQIGLACCQDRWRAETAA